MNHSSFLCVGLFLLQIFMQIIKWAQLKYAHLKENFVTNFWVDKDLTLWDVLFMFILEQILNVYEISSVSIILAAEISEQMQACNVQMYNM